jgi:hypothetical protein
VMLDGTMLWRGAVRRACLACGAHVLGSAREECACCGSRRLGALAGYATGSAGLDAAAAVAPDDAGSAHTRPSENPPGPMSSPTLSRARKFSQATA